MTTLSVDLLKAIAVTAELCGRQFTPEAARVFASDLSHHSEPAVLRALAKCRREVRGILTTADVLSRIDDGRPGAEEAWAMVPLDEWKSVVWTTEMAEAYGICHHMVATDKVGARMAFKEAYLRLVAAARDAGRAAVWTPSLGHDPQHRVKVLEAAVEAGRLGIEHAQQAYPALPAPQAFDKEAEGAQLARAAVDAVLASKQATDSLAWARALRTAERGGLPTTEAQRLAWRNALNEGYRLSGPIPGEFKGVAESALPPGMRRDARAAEGAP